MRFFFYRKANILTKILTNKRNELNKNRSESEKYNELNPLDVNDIEIALISIATRKKRRPHDFMIGFLRIFFRMA